LEKECKLSLLEVKGLDCNSENKGKAHGDSTDHKCTPSYEVVLDTKIVVKESLHIFSTFGRHNSSYISKLRCNQSIDGPCNWTCPIVPSPPYWNALLSKGKKKKKKVSILHIYNIQLTILFKCTFH